MSKDFGSETCRVNPDDQALQFRLLRQLMEGAPFQPATNLWRAIELPALAAALPTSGRGLDVGCGDGVLTGIVRQLLGARWALVGVDMDPAETALAADSGFYEQVHTAPASSIPEPAGSFDFAFANSVLEHIPNLGACLSEVYRCLRPGGVFAATVPSQYFHRCLGGPDWTWPMSRPAYIDMMDRRLAHVHYWAAERWEEELRERGFEPNPPAWYMSRNQVRRWEALSNWTGGLLYRLHGRKDAPIQIQRRFGFRRRLPAGAGFLALPIARFISCGVLGDRAADPGANGGLLVRASKPAR